MKIKFYFSLILIFTLSHIFSQDNEKGTWLQSWVSRLERYDEDFQELILSRVLDDRIHEDSQFSFLPKLNLTPAYSVSRTLVEDTLISNQSFSSYLNFSQSIPWYGSWTAGLQNRWEWSLDSVHTISGSLSFQTGLSQPLYWPNTGPTAIEHISIERKRQELWWAWASKERVLESLDQAFQYLSLRSLQELQEEYLNWDLEYRNFLEQQHQLGLISLLELQEAEQEGRNREQAFRNRGRQIRELEFSLPKESILLLTSLEDLLSLLEGEIQDYFSQPLSQILSELELARWEESKSLSFQSHVATLPLLDVSFEITPLPVQSTSMDWADSWSSWQRDLGDSPWTFRISVSLPLMPFDLLYRSLETRSLMEERQEISLRNLEREEINRRVLAIDQNLLNLEAKDMFQRLFGLEKDRLELMMIRRDQGRTSDLEYRRQVLQVEQARLQWLIARGTEKLHHLREGME
jgi:hypothetical protein